MRLSCVEFICIVAIGVAMVELAPNARNARAGKAGASALIANLAATPRSGLPPDVVIPRSIGRDP
jgi:hypothetical protein